MAVFIYETLVTKEDYLQSTGVDLYAELAAVTINDVGDDPVPRFIYGVEEFLKDYYSAPPYSWDGNPLLPKQYDNNGVEIKETHRIKCFKKAVIYQIQYLIRNGSIFNDSGYNVQTGQIVPREQLEKIGVAPLAHRQMRMGGMANLMRC